VQPSKFVILNNHPKKRTEDMIYKYGIDFGTTNSSIAVRFVGDDRAEHTLVVDVRDTLPRETIPSVVLVDRGGKIFAGEDAMQSYLRGGANQRGNLFLKKIKLDLEHRGSELEYIVGKKTVSGTDLIASILKVLRLRAEKIVEELDIEMSGVVMGVPVQYGDIQKNVLKKALVKAGFYSTEVDADRHTEFVSEPVAVAVHYGLNLQRDTTVMVFDFGGGTLDVAIVNLKQQVGADRLHPHETIAKERITLGGEELNRLFFINSFCSPQKYGAKRIGMEFGFGAGCRPDQLWDKLTSCEEGIKFISSVERCKCELSRSQKCRFSYIGRNIQLEEKTFYRDDFAEAISEKLDEIDTLLDECMENGDISDPYEIDHVILAGGSSMIPAVQDMLCDKFGNTRVSSKLPEKDAVVKAMKRGRAVESEVLTSIVRGLAMVGCKDESLFEDVVDSDYGVWDSVKDRFVPIIRKGTHVKETNLDRLSRQGIFRPFRCDDYDVSSVEVLVYQRTKESVSQLGIINIPSPGGKKYDIYMQVNRKNGMLEVFLFDKLQQRWIDEIPLNERQYTISERS